MAERLMILCLAVVLGCGDDDDGGPVDGGGDACVLNVRSGAMGGDGSMAAPFGRLDDALAVAVSGDVVCLGSGEFVPPGGAITVPVVIRGQGSAESAASSVITSALGGCQPASLLTQQRAPVRDRVDTDAVVVTTAPVTLESLVLTGCSVGVAGVAADLTLDDVRIQDVISGVHVEDAALTVRDSIFSPGTSFPYPPDGPAAAGAFVTGGSATITGTTFDTDRALAGLLGFESGIDLDTSTLFGGYIGFGILNDTAGQSVRVGTGTVVEGLRDAGESVARNVVFGATVDVEGLIVRDSEGTALAIGDGTAMVRDVQLAGTDGLVVRGASVTLAGTNRIDSTFRGMLVAGSEDGPGNLTIEGSVESRGTPLGHVAVIDAGDAATLTVGGSLDLEGGEGGIVTFAPSSTVTVTGALRMSTLALAGAIAFEGNVDLGAATIDGAGIGAFGSGDASLTLDGATITNIEIGVALQDSAVLSATDVVVTDPSEQGMRLRGGASTVTGGSITGAGSVGILTTADATIDGTSISETGGVGIEAQDGAAVTVTNASFDSNVGAGVAFRNSSGEVSGSSFAGSLPNARGRADEILLDAQDVATTREVIVRANNFDLTVPRTCIDECAVFMADGPGAVGIVMPNCLRASADPGTRTVVDQDGASIMADAGLVWTGLLAGLGTDLGLTTGSSASAPTRSVMLDASAIPDVFSPPR